MLWLMGEGGLKGLGSGAYLTMTIKEKAVVKDRKKRFKHYHSGVKQIKRFSDLRSLFEDLTAIFRFYRKRGTKARVGDLYR